MPAKKKKLGRGSVEGFDATPPDDGNMISGNGKRSNQSTPNPLQEGKQGVLRGLSAYWNFLKGSFRNSPRYQQESYINRLSLICCIGVGIVVLNCFYSVLIPAIRIISLPIVIGVGWFLADKVVAPAIIKRLGNNMNSD